MHCYFCKHVSGVFQSGFDAIAESCWSQVFLFFLQLKLPHLRPGRLRYWPRIPFPNSVSLVIYIFFSRLSEWHVLVSSWRSNPNKKASWKEKPSEIYASTLWQTNMVMGTRVIVNDQQKRMSSWVLCCCTGWKSRKFQRTRRRMARERRGAGSSLVSMETPYYKTIY